MHLQNTEVHPPAHGGEFLYGVVEFKRGFNGIAHIEFVVVRQSEQRHDAIATHLVDDTAVPSHDAMGDALERVAHAVDGFELATHFRDQCGIATEVRKQHCGVPVLTVTENVMLGVESLRGGGSAEVLRLATELEGHADNVAASLYGGVVATAAGRVVHVPLGFDPAVVVWVPSFTTSTDDSRHRLRSTVPFDDAVFNVGRTALLVAALAGGDVHALRDATQDRLHQAARLAMADSSREALQAGVDAGAWCGWLSGSGPTIALLCAPDLVDRVIAGLPESGRSRHLRIDHAGAVVEGA